MTNDFLTAAADAVRSRDSRALQYAIAGSTEPRQQTQQLFREELPMLLDPPDLLWLLQEMTSPEEFERNRDTMLDALSEDLCRNGYVPGIDFSILPSEYSGKTVHVNARCWEDVQQQLSPRALQHYRCFVEVSEC